MDQGDRAIVLGCRHGGLAVVRSLARHGVRVLVLSHSADDPGLTSRFVKEWHLCPHPQEEEALIEALVSYAEEWRGALIFTTSDYFTAVVSRNAERLEAHYKLDVAPWEHTRVFLEKDQTYALASAVSVPHPRILQPTSEPDIEQKFEELQMPVMIKPVHSHRFVEVFGTKLFICDSVAELRSNYQRAVDAGQQVIISEVIPGSDYLTLETIQIYIDQYGRVAASFCLTKLRQTPPMYGVIRVGKSIPATEELQSLAMRLLHHIDYRGYASVEFKRDPRDGELKLIEVNVRPLRMSQFAIGCGVDFPYISMQDKVHGHQVIPGPYHHDVYYIDVVAELLDVVRFSEYLGPKRLLEPYLGRRKSYPYLSFQDPRPFISELGRRARQAFSRVRDSAD